MKTSDCYHEKNLIRGVTVLINKRNRKKTEKRTTLENTSEQGNFGVHPVVRIREINMDCYRGKNKGGIRMLYNSTIIGLVISMERVKRGMTQEQLSGLADISRSHLAALEKGQKSPKVETLWRIAEALSVKPSKLLMMAEKIMERNDTNDGE